MKQIRVHGPHDVRLDDVPSTPPGPRDAVVRMAACGICGTDVSFVHMGGITGRPMPLGHEMAGVVEWAGAEVDGVAPGDRVIVHPADEELGRLGSGAAEGGLTPLLARPGGGQGPTPVPGPRRHGSARRRAGGARCRRHAGGEPGRGRTRGAGGRGRVRPDRPPRHRHAGRPRRPRRGGDRHEPAPARIGAAIRRRPRDQPPRGRPVGRARTSPWHGAVHVRPHAGHRRLHRGVGIGPDARRDHRAGALRRAHVARGAALHAGARRTSSRS